MIQANQFVICHLPEGKKSMLSPEQLEEGKRRLVSQALGWLNLDETARAQWLDTKTDLLEIVRYVYESQLVVAKDGRPASFRWLAMMFAQKLHTSFADDTLYRLSYQAESRKGVIMPTMLWRYTWRMFVAMNPDPLQNLVVCLSPHKA